MIQYIVIVLYLSVVAFLGWYMGRGNKTAKDYILGGGTIPWWTICFAIVAAETSALTFISIPGLAYLTNLNFLQVTLGYLIGRIVISYTLLPRYFSGEQLTAYAFLENRFGSKTRSFASVVFLFTRVLADGVRLFATAIPIKLMLGIEYPYAILIIAVVTLFYTSTGGLKGIIWVDALQMLIYIGGAVVAGYYLINLLPQGLGNALASTGAAGKLDVVSLGFENGIAGFFAKPYTLLGGVLGGAFLSMASHGTDQLVVQRLLASKNLSEGRKAIIGSGVIVVFQFVLFMLVGVLLYAYYGPLPLKSDEIFPKFILEQLPPVITGIIVAGLLAAALSTLAGSMSSLSASSLADLYLPLSGKKLNDEQQLKLSRKLIFFWCGVLVLSAFFFMNTNRAVVELALSIASFTYGGLLGVFLLGMIDKKATQEDALAGFTAGIFIMVAVISVKLTAWTWFTVIGSGATVIIGMLTARLGKKQIS